MSVRGVLLALFCVLPAAVQAQTSPPDVPLTPAERIEWVVDGTIGFRSLAIVGPMGAAFQTGVNTPPEWERSWNGAAKRYLQREADVAISNSIEAGLGALWDEDVLYRRRGHGPFGARVRHAIGTAFVAQHADRKLHPAWARYAANILNNIIENTWLPPSARTARQTTIRSGLGMATRIGGNAFEEFWPDVRRLLQRKRGATHPLQP